MLGGCTHMRFALNSGECPPDFPIKGNANSAKYHVPESPWYYRTKAEVCFSTEEAARRNGYVTTKHN
jgi:large subunit ribosomal protein L4